MFKKIYVEITNACNLSCSFCHGTKREIKFMSENEFTRCLEKLRGHTEYVYFHLLGEPLLHPLLNKFFDICHSMNFKVIITTNGTMLQEKESILLSASSLHKISISLHCHEANSTGPSLDEYLNACFDFCLKASDKKIISVLRLWNLGGEDKMNSFILEKMKTVFTKPWQETYSGFKLSDRCFLEWGEKFEWPDINADDVGYAHSCYGLRDQIGILCDGSVVPCCLDAEGDITLGNIFESSLEEIITSPRAIALKKSFEMKNVSEELCRRCGFASRFK